jgi:hypothetical protein
VVPRETLVAQLSGLRANFQSTGGKEIAHGRMKNGIETIYSVSLAGVQFEDSPTGTLLTYTEQAFYLDKDYGNEGRIEGTNGLLDRFTTYLTSIT